MKLKIALIFIFSALTVAVSAAPLRSDWIYYGESSKSNFEAYYAPSSIKREGALIIIKIVKNFEEPVEFTAEEPHFKFLSSVETQEVNCEKRIYRNIRSEKWSERWGMGTLGIAYDYVGNKQTKWSELIRTNQVQGGLLAKVCKLIYVNS